MKTHSVVTQPGHRTGTGNGMQTTQENVYVSTPLLNSRNVDGGPRTVKSPRNAWDKCKLFESTSSLQGIITWEVGSRTLHFTQVARRFFYIIKLRSIVK